jgi:tetratricopeptide (TPR) repeat protein
LFGLLNWATREPATLGLVERVVRLCESSGNVHDKAHLYVVLMAVFQAHGMLDDAELAAKRGAELVASEEVHDSSLAPAFHVNRHDLYVAQGRFDEARAALAAAEALVRSREERLFLSQHCYSRYATLEYAVGNKTLALEYAERMLSEFPEDNWIREIALERIAILRLDVGDLDGAVEPLRELLTLLPENRDFLQDGCEIAAMYLALRDRFVEAATILGAVQIVRESTHFRRHYIRQTAYDRLCALLQEKLTPSALARAQAEGASWTADRAREEALSALD